MNDRSPKELKRPRGALVRAWKRHIFDRMTVDRSSGCWIIQTPREENGFAKTTALAVGRIWAHRLSYLAFKGNVPEGALVTHVPTCRSRACVNPTHLALGTPKALAKNRDLRGKTVRGEAHPRAKLKDADVARIREMSEEFPPEMIALAYEIDVTTVRKIVNFKRRDG